MSELRVCKFGGTSVASAAQLRQVQSIIDREPSRRIIVPSAPGRRTKDEAKITDLLYLAQELGGKKQKLDSIWTEIEDRFTGIVRELGLDLDLKPELDAVRRALEVGTTPAYAASRGEAINGRIVAALLGATYVDAAEVIRFTPGGRFDETSYELIEKRCSGPGRFVVPGFYGADGDGKVHTFSRGGSDLSGAIVAAALGAEVYENWTDVSGVLAADPSIVPHAKRIAEITYTELRELAYTGARVLHEEAVFPVRRSRIPIHILNTFAPDDAGTVIRSRRNAGEQVVVGVAGLKGFTVFHIEKVLMNAELGFGRRVLDVFERLQISYEHMPSGIDTMSVVVSDKHLKSQADQVVEDLQGAVRPDRVRVYPGMALIATVGLGMSRRVGVAARLFAALARASVNIRMIDQGSSEQNIIVGVEEADFERAVATIYEEFIAG